MDGNIRTNLREGDLREGKAWGRGGEEGVGKGGRVEDMGKGEGGGEEGVGKEEEEIEEEGKGT